MNLCEKCERRTFCQASTLCVGETTICANFIPDEMLKIVTCKYCKHQVEYGNMIWLNGKCMCPSCYHKERNK